ncbi:MAG TPA: cytochrome c biogenesis protein ResB [Pyrinomonadaceae bacterium]
MSAIEETKTSVGVKPTIKPATTASVPPLTRALNFLSSVRFGVTLLVLLAAACMIGMLIMQQNVEGFDKYYAALTPSQQLLGSKLGLFDIYHIWYFNLILLVLSLNIVLASIDRFPKAWTFVSRPKLDASARWLQGQPANATLKLKGESQQDVAERLVAASKSVGMTTKTTEKNGRVFVFAQKNVWNRLGAYAVHVALLTIFTGGFLTSHFGRTGQMWLKPGMTSNEMMETVFVLDQPERVTLSLPFDIACTDIQQKLIEKNGPITSSNTIDWSTNFRIKDEYGEREAAVHLNAPYDYRGYRFFQESFAAIGRARTITVRLTPQGGATAAAAPQDVKIARDGKAELSDGTVIQFADFSADFKLGAERDQSESADYTNPAAALVVTRPGEQPQRAYAFTPAMAEKAPIAKQPVAGYTYALVDFEKVPEMHALSIQRDPGARVVYIGFALLALTLVAVFFFSHQRVWMLIEEGKGKTYEVVMGGNTNRNRLAFEERFKKLTAAISGKPHEVKQS